jgi:hypothetical protein
MYCVIVERETKRGTYGGVGLWICTQIEGTTPIWQPVELGTARTDWGQQALINVGQRELKLRGGAGVKSGASFCCVCGSVAAGSGRAVMAKRAGGSGPSF